MRTGRHRTPRDGTAERGRWRSRARWRRESHGTSGIQTGDSPLGNRCAPSGATRRRRSAGGRGGPDPDLGHGVLREGLPLHRITTILRPCGARVPDGTLVGIFEASQLLLQPMTSPACSESRDAALYFSDSPRLEVETRLHPLWCSQDLLPAQDVPHRLSTRCLPLLPGLDPQRVPQHQPNSTLPSYPWKIFLDRG